MTGTVHRRRAPGMSPDQRREMIVRAALPLVAERGAAVTTAQVARAAGIGEATIFRVFPDKEALLGACVAEALDVSHVERELRSISLDEPLATRLIEAADALRAHMVRMGTVIGALAASGHRGRPEPGGRPDPGARPGLSARPAPGGGDALSASRESAHVLVREALAELFEPEREALRLPVETLIEIFIALLSARFRTMGDAQPPVSTADLVTVFLDGAHTPPRRSSS